MSTSSTQRTLSTSSTMSAMSTLISDRLRNQLLTRKGLRTPADVVSWMGAVQAQEFEAAKWGLGLRLRDGATDAQVQRDFDEGRVLRTHVMRPTWHFVTPADIRWMLELTAPRVQRIMSTYVRNVGLDAPLLARSARLIERALGEHGALTRAELSEALRRSAIALTGIRLAIVTMYAELEAVVCSGPRRGKQFTYALLAERAPNAVRLSRDEALATLARRYFASHGPATLRDFVWWSGLFTADARRAIEIANARSAAVDGQTYWTVGSRARAAAREGVVHLLPIYDEYLVAYRDRAAVPHVPRAITSAVGGFGTFQHAIVIRGQVAGTWRVSRSPRGVSAKAFPLRRISGTERRALADAARSYERFLRVPVQFAVGVR